MAAGKRKLILQTITTATDHQTGEVLHTTDAQVIRFPAEPPYVKMYINDLCSLVGVTDADQALLRHLLARLDYEGYVTLSSRSRKSIAASLGIEAKTLRNRLSKLVAADLICNVSLNEYQVNPRYFARGDWKKVCEQQKAYELRIRYSSDKGRQIDTMEVEGDDHLQEELPI